MIDGSSQPLPIVIENVVLHCTCPLEAQHQCALFLLKSSHMILLLFAVRLTDTTDEHIYEKTRKTSPNQLTWHPSLSAKYYHRFLPKYLGLFV